MSTSKNTKFAHANVKKHGSTRPQKFDNSTKLAALAMATTSALSTIAQATENVATIPGGFDTFEPKVASDVNTSNSMELSLDSKTTLQDLKMAYLFGINEKQTSAYQLYYANSLSDTKNITLNKVPDEQASLASFLSEHEANSLRFFVVSSINQTEENHLLNTRELYKQDKDGFAKTSSRINDLAINGSFTLNLNKVNANTALSNKKLANESYNGPSLLSPLDTGLDNRSSSKSASVNSSTMGNSVATNNVALLSSYDGPSTTISNAKYENKTASSDNPDGAAINAYNESIYIITDSKFLGNSASNGGAIKVYSTDLSLDNNEFLSNKATNKGGAVFAAGPINGNNKLEVINTKFRNNSANQGGGVITTLATFNTIKGSYFGYNESSLLGDHMGGGIWNGSGSLEISDTEFEFNFAAYGGAVATHGVTTILDSQFMQNCADQGGGALYLDADTTIENTYFFENHADYGSAIYIASGKTELKDGVNFYTNYGDNGEIYVSSESTLKLSNTDKAIFLEDGISGDKCDPEGDDCDTYELGKVILGDNTSGLIVKNKLNNLNVEIGKSTLTLGTGTDTSGTKLKMLADSHLILRNGTIEATELKKLDLSGDGDKTISIDAEVSNNAFFIDQLLTDDYVANDPQNVNLNVNLNISEDMAPGVVSLSSDYLITNVYRDDSSVTQPNYGFTLNNNTTYNTDKYRYELSVASNNSEEPENILKLTKVGTYVGLAKAIADGDASYDMSANEILDVRGIKSEDGAVDDGSLKNSLTINGNGNILESRINGEAIGIGNYNLTLNDVKLQNGSGSLSINDGGSLYLKGSTISNNKNSGIVNYGSGEIYLQNSSSIINNQEPTEELDAGFIDSDIWNKGDLFIVGDDIDTDDPNNRTDNRIGVIRGEKDSTTVIEGNLTLGTIVGGDIGINTDSILTLTNATTLENGIKCFVPLDGSHELGKVILSDSNPGLTVNKELSYLSVDIGNSTLNLGSGMDTTGSDIKMSGNSHLNLQNGAVESTMLTKLDLTGEGDKTISIDAETRGNYLVIDQLYVDNYAGNDSQKVNVNVNLTINEDLSPNYLSVDSEPLLKTANMESLWVDAPIRNVNLNVNKTIYDTDKYRYELGTSSYYTSNGEVENRLKLTRIGSYTGLAKAIADGASSYDVSSDEILDVMGVREDGVLDDGSLKQNLSINGKGNTLKARYSWRTISIGDKELILSNTKLTNSDSILNSQGPLSINNGALTLDGASVYHNYRFGLVNNGNGQVNLKNSSSIIDNIDMIGPAPGPGAIFFDNDIQNKGQLTITTDNTDNKIGAIRGESGSTTLINGNLSIDTILGTDLTLGENSKLTLTDAGLIDLSGASITLKYGAGINDEATATGKAVLNVSTVDMQNGGIDDIAFDTLDVSGINHLKLDADLYNQSIDTISYQGTGLTFNEDAVLNIDAIHLLSDMADDIKQVMLSPIAGLQSGAMAIMNTAYTRDDVILGDKYAYVITLSDCDGSSCLLFNRIGASDNSLTGLAKALQDGEASYTMNDDETIDLWGTNGSAIDPTLGGRFTINARGNKILGGNNLGFNINDGKELDLNDVAEIGGFNSELWQGGTILNNGVTTITAQNTDTVFKESKDISGTNAIRNNAELNLKALNDHEISFEAPVTGNGYGVINVDGTVKFTDVSGNDINVDRGSITFSNLDITGQKLTLNNTSGSTIGDGKGVITGGIDDYGKSTELHLKNGAFDTINVDTIHAGDNISVDLDASLDGEGKIDTVKGNKIDGHITVDSLEVAGDLAKGKLSTVLNPFIGGVTGDVSYESGITGNIFDSKLYRYGVDVNQDTGAITFTKKAMLTGLADAIAKGISSYTLNGNETLEAWGVGSDGIYNQGVISSNLAIIGDGTSIISGLASSSQSASTATPATIASTADSPVVMALSEVATPQDVVTLAEAEVGAEEVHLNGFTVTNGATLSMSDIREVRDFASLNGGAFNNEGTLNLKDVGITGNAASGLGGAIYNTGLVNIEANTDATILGNTDSTGANAIYNKGVVNIKAASGTTYTISDAVTGENGKLNFTGAGTNVIAGSVTGNTIGLTNGELRFTDKAKTDNTTGLNAESGVVDIGTNHLALKDASFKDGSTLRLGINSIEEYGQIKADTFTIGAAALELIVGNNVVNIGESADFTLFASDNGVTDNFAPTISNLRYNIEQKGDGVYHIVFTKTNEDLVRESGGSETLAGVARAWGDSGEMPAENQAANAVQRELNLLSQTDNKAFIDTLNTISPSAAPVVQITQMQIANSIWTLGADRGHSRAVGTSNFSVDSDLGNSFNYWLTISGNKSRFNPSGSYADTDMSYYQIASGLDSRIGKNAYAGLGYARTKHNIDAFRRDLDAGSNTIMAYGGWDGESWFADGVLGYTWTHFDEKKTVANQKANATFKANTVNAKVMGGYKSQITDNLTIKPAVGIKTLNTKRKAYHDDLGQNVGSARVKTTTTELGATLVYNDKSKLDASLAAFYGYDVKADKESATVTTLNGSSYKATSERLNRNSFSVSAGVGYHPTANTTIGVGYEGNFRKNYVDNSARLSIELKF